jgi:hypothetical protein
MSLALLIRQAVRDLGKDRLWVDSKSMADYASRIARTQGQALRQRKMEMGGWELRTRHLRRTQTTLF